MDFDQIMGEITSGLSGDYKADMVYLEEQSEKYKDHEMATEIIRACGRIMYEIMPDDAREELSKAVQKDELKIEATLEEVKFNIFQKNYTKAEKMMVALVEKVDDLAEAGMYQNDTVSEYYEFNEFFEQILLEEIYKPKREVRYSDIPYAEVYFLYGYLLAEIGKEKDANRILEKATKRNPVRADIAFEYAETYKKSGDFDRFFELSKEIFKISFKPKDVARCYRNLAFYFVEKKLWSEAIACNIMSMQYGKESTNAQSELYYIQHVTNGSVKEPSADEFKQYAEKYGFPLGPDNDVLGLAYAYGKHFYENKEYEGARYFLSILYSLTDDDDVKQLLEDIPS